METKLVKRIKAFKKDRFNYLQDTNDKSFLKDMYLITEDELKKLSNPELLESLTILQQRLEMLINLIPTGEKRNQLTEENIKALLIIQKATE